MTESEAIKLMLIEKECINRKCDRNCAICDIVQKIEDLNNAYDLAIQALEKQAFVDKDLESHDEKHILKYCISLMQELADAFEEWYSWMHGEDAIEELDEEERFCYRMTYFHIVQELFLFNTYHSGGTSTRAKCEQLGVDSCEEIKLDWSEEE